MVSAKLQKWIDDLITTKLWPLNEDIDDKLSPNIRAIQFNLFENLGALPIEKYKNFLKNISVEEKNTLLAVCADGDMIYISNIPWNTLCSFTTGAPKPDIVKKCLKQLDIRKTKLAVNTMDDDEFEAIYEKTCAEFEVNKERIKKEEELKEQEKIIEKFN